LPLFPDLGANLVALLPQNAVNSRKSVRGDTSWTLPMPGRFANGQDRVIRYAEVNPRSDRCRPTYCPSCGT
jgi:hypothetical protein